MGAGRRVGRVAWHTAHERSLPLAAEPATPPVQPQPKPLSSPLPCHSSPPLPPCSYGAFWMSLAIYTTLAAAGVFVGTGATADQFPVKGDRLMLTLWGILVSALQRALCCACRQPAHHTRVPAFGPIPAAPRAHPCPRLPFLAPPADLPAVAVHLPHQRCHLLAVPVPGHPLLAAGWRRDLLRPRAD